jgi:hypothetical protein
MLSRLPDQAWREIVRHAKSSNPQIIPLPVAAGYRFENYTI